MTMSLRALCRPGKLVKVAGVYDALTARIAEEVGFDAVWVAGYPLSASLAAKPDMGLLTRTEVVAVARKVVAAVSIPVVVDAETGFGSALNVIETVREIESAGAVAMQLDDYSVETCPYIGRPLPFVSTDEMVGKVQAAISARKNPDFSILATGATLMRKDPRRGLERIKAVVEAGSDGLLIQWDVLEGAGLTLREFVTLVGAEDRMLIDINIPWQSPPPDRELERMGYHIVCYPVEALYAAIPAQIRVLTDLVRRGFHAGLKAALCDQEVFMRLVGIEVIAAQAARYVPERPGPVEVVEPRT